jgi:hypothetical protein
MVRKSRNVFIKKATNAGKKRDGKMGEKMIPNKIDV